MDAPEVFYRRGDSTRSALILSSTSGRSRGSHSYRRRIPLIVASSWACFVSRSRRSRSSSLS